MVGGRRRGILTSGCRFRKLLELQSMRWTGWKFFLSCRGKTKNGGDENGGGFVTGNIAKSNVR